MPASMQFTALCPQGLGRLKRTLQSHSLSFSSSCSPTSSYTHAKYTSCSRSALTKGSNASCTKANSSGRTSVWRNGGHSKHASWVEASMVGSSPRGLTHLLHGPSVSSLRGNKQRPEDTVSARASPQGQCQGRDLVKDCTPVKGLREGEKAKGPTELLGLKGTGRPFLPDGLPGSQSGGDTWCWSTAPRACYGGGGGAAFTTERLSRKAGLSEHFYMYLCSPNRKEPVSHLISIIL